jgi:hypothetical protein
VGWLKKARASGQWFITNTGEEINIEEDGSSTHEYWARRYLQPDPENEDFDAVGTLLNQGWVRVWDGDTFLNFEVADLAHAPYSLMDDFVAKHWQPDGQNAVIVEDRNYKKKTIPDPLIGIEKALKSRQRVFARR